MDYASILDATGLEPYGPRASPLSFLGMSLCSASLVISILPLFCAILDSIGQCCDPRKLRNNPCRMQRICRWTWNSVYQGVYWSCCLLELLTRRCINLIHSIWTILLWGARSLGEAYQIKAAASSPRPSTSTQYSVLGSKSQTSSHCNRNPVRPFSSYG